MSDTVLEVRDITKGYAGVQALAGVGFRVRAGEIHALAGQNGAGKSTLVKILSGAETPDSGVIEVDGQPVRLRKPIEAQNAGIHTIHQELSLVPTLTVAENVFLSGPPTRRGVVAWSVMKAQAEEALARVGVQLDVSRLVSSYSVAEQQAVELAKAIHRDARVLLLDEPTSALPQPEVRRLFQALRRLAAQGVAMVFISHRMDELYDLCDSVTVLRDGELVSEMSTSDTRPNDVVTAMVGRSLAGSMTSAAQTGSGTPSIGSGRRGGVLLEAHGLGDGTRVEDVDLTLHEGEVLGITGLIGSGQSELADILAGNRRRSVGSVRFGGRAVDYRSPRQAIRDGIGLLPQDRKAHGFIPGMSVTGNITLASMPMFSRAGIIESGKERKAAVALAERLRMRISGVNQPMGTLSGGTQQKAILARWLVRSSRLLICDEPTRGVDVGAKEDMYELLRDFARDGGTVVIASSEISEAMMCDRVLVMAHGRVVAELTHDEVGPEGRAILDHLE
ncbi:sugar ABC transporter ATP-binding protein [Curtobacterium sp. RRHDQ10]|jgi:ribose transport system ATP-binding protein|uniref:sugar ABC transporter ATP-binding protein n=1 Tax=Curtobacterium phyllosphaerae TaxID=3413379 RepID=UPI003BF04155